MTDRTTPGRSLMMDYLAETTRYSRGQVRCDCCGGAAVDPPSDPDAIAHEAGCAVRIAWRLIDELVQAEEDRDILRAAAGGITECPDCDCRAQYMECDHEQACALRRYIAAESVMHRLNERASDD